METIMQKSGTTLIVCLVGKLNTNAAPKLEGELRHSLDGITELIFECKELVYLTSAGIRVLVAAQKAMSRQGTMVLRNVQEEIMDLFEMTGLDDVFMFE